MITNEFKFGLNYFSYKSNTIFGVNITKHFANDIIVYKAIQENIGYVFYKKRLRENLDVLLFFLNMNLKFLSIIIDKFKLWFYSGL